MRPRTESRLQWLHFEGASTRAHSLPANVLVKSIHQLQRVVYLLAKLHRGEDLGQRLRMPKDLEDRFELICKIPVEGSYALPYEIGGGPVARTTSFDDKDLSDVCRQFQEVTRAIGSGNIDSLSDAVPSPAYRAALIKAYRAMQPPKRYGVDCSITEGNHSFFIYCTQAGKKTTVRTKTSHGRGNQDIGDRLTSRMAKQCKLTNADFRQLVDCRLSRKRYEEKLKASGAVGSSKSGERRRARKPWASAVC